MLEVITFAISHENYIWIKKIVNKLILFCYYSVFGTDDDISYAVRCWLLLSLFEKSKLQSQSTSCPNSIAQHAASEALSGDQGAVKIMRDKFKKRRDFIVNELNSIDGVSCESPGGAFYVFPDVSKFFGKTIKGFKIENSSDFAMFLLEKAHVATVTGEAFGCPDNIRISYAASKENIIEAVKRIKNVLS